VGAGPSQTRANSLANRSQSCFEEQNTDRSASSIAATPAFCTMRNACKQSSVVLPEPNPLARAQRQNRTTARSRLRASSVIAAFSVFIRSYGELRRAIAKRLEGSRFGAYPATLAAFVSTPIQPKRVKSGGSRERFSAIHLPCVLRFRLCLTDRAANRWVVRGSRLLTLFLIGSSVDANKANS
jgi:hypothetical protein